MIFGAIKRTEIGPMLTLCRGAVKELELAKAKSESGCGTCSFFTGGRAGKCSKHNAPVPIEFQPQGCDDWTHDDIPF
jgi:hypothetical protein